MRKKRTDERRRRGRRRREVKSCKERNADGLLLFKGSKLFNDDYTDNDKVAFATIALFGKQNVEIIVTLLH